MKTRNQETFPAKDKIDPLIITVFKAILFFLAACWVLVSAMPLVWLRLKTAKAKRHLYEPWENRSWKQTLTESHARMSKAFLSLLSWDGKGKG